MIPCSNELILIFLCIAVTSIVGNSEDNTKISEVIYYTVKGFCSGLKSADTCYVYSFDNNCSLFSLGPPPPPPPQNYHVRPLGLVIICEEVKKE